MAVYLEVQSLAKFECLLEIAIPLNSIPVIEYKLQCE